MELELYDEEESINPCWEIKLDLSKSKIIFLVNGKNKMSFFSSKVNGLKYEDILDFLKLLKENNLKKILKRLKDD